MVRLDDFAPLSDAEQVVVDGCSTPSRITLGDGEFPDAASPGTEVRADLLRHVLLGRDVALHDKGLRLAGAWISGALDLQGCEITRDITLVNCRLAERASLVNASLRSLSLSGCLLKGIDADHARFSGSLYIRGGTRSEGEIVLAGVSIAGDLQLCGAEILGEGQDAVFAPSLRVGGSVFLGNYPYSEGTTELVARGSLFFASARVENDLFINRVSLSLNEGVVGQGIFGNTEEHGASMALSLSRARVGGILFFLDNQFGQGLVNLSGATVTRLKDEPSGPGASYPIRLDGFRYEDFSRHADTGVEARLAWLDRRPAGTPFNAQPYEQLAQVLRRIGHREDANRVLLEKERRLRAAQLDDLRARHGHGLRWAGLAMWDRFLRFTVGYGFRPGRSLLVAVVLIGGLAVLAHRTWQAGDMAPNAAPILVSRDWIAATEAFPDNPAAAWASPTGAGKDYETFQPVAYAADLLVPLVDLGQEAAWAPSTSRSDWGRALWWVRWLAKAVGWVIAALAAAAITGVIRRE